MKDYLIVSEMFYSIQGEGKYLGTPAVFLRLAACNLSCQGFSYKHPDTGEHLGCDTAAVWRKGERWHFDKIMAHWEAQGWLAHLAAGAHLVITGGEPLIQQTTLIAFMAMLPGDYFIEIETNATIMLEPELLERLNQINASPKLNHAGDPLAKRYQPEVLKQLAHHHKAYFKFVLAKPEHLDEIMSDYIQKFEIPTQKISLMAEGGTRKCIDSKAIWLVELCKKFNFRYTPRLHIDIWGEVTGV